MQVTRSPVSSGACRICGAATSRSYSMCTSCRDVAVALGRPPTPVACVALVCRASPLYRALRQYKSGEPGVAERQRARLARLLDTFFERHARCIAPGGLDVCAVVPSLRTGRPPPHPLAALVAATASLPPLEELLVAGDAAVGHRRPAATAYRVTGDVSNARLLLVDDVYTSGAHFQSAAAALLDAGAREVAGLVVGRYVRARAQKRRCARCQR